MAIYAEAISHPFMRIVRQPGSENVNLLTLGPTFSRLKEHMQSIIDSPQLLLAADASHTSGSLDGQVWTHPDVFYHVQAMIAQKEVIPELDELLRAFFIGARDTGERFTEEFIIGGFIDSATAAQRERAFMPSTNDHNEGALGQMRQGKIHNPNLTTSQLSYQNTFWRNDTQAFMQAKFATAEEHSYLMKAARNDDSSGKEKLIRAAIVEEREKRAEAGRAKEQRTQAISAARDDRLSKVSLELDKAKVDRMRSKELDDQIDLHRSLEPGSARAKITPSKSGKDVQQKRQVVHDAIDRYIQANPESQSSSTGLHECQVRNTDAESDNDSD